MVESRTQFSRYIHLNIKTALCNLWSGVMELSLGVKPWRGVLEWILDWNEVRFGVIVSLHGQISSD